MDKKIIVFSGMPASGKDTVTDKLCELNSLYVPLKKYRSVGPEDKIKNTYFNITKEEFEEKIKIGQFLQYHKRYGRYYGIAEKTLFDLLEKGKTPIIHIGRIQNYHMFCNNLPIFEKKYDISVKVVHILLWETEDVLSKRIVARDKNVQEIAKRKEAMEQEFNDNILLMQNDEHPYSIIIKNLKPDSTCKIIINYLEKSENIIDGYDEFWGYLKYLQERKI